MEEILPSSEDLMWVGLVSGVPNDLIEWCVEHIVQSNGELNGSKACAKVSTYLSNHGDQMLTNFIGDFAQVGWSIGP